MPKLKKYMCKDCGHRFQNFDEDIPAGGINTRTGEGQVDLMKSDPICPQCESSNIQKS